VVVMGALSMGEFKFNCPSCSQKIQCTEDWVGQQIQCPGCQQNIQVPAAPESAPAAQEAKPASRLSLGLAQHQKTAPPPVATFSHGTNPTRHVSASQAPRSASSKAD
jgi:DNA-directed RNA polymerase subunit RPC12/RpoP